MYYDFLFKAFNMSVTASWLILAVLLLRFVFKKAPKWLRVALWGVVGLRLLLPFSLQSRVSLVPSTDTVYNPVRSSAVNPTPNVAFHSGFAAVDEPVNTVLWNYYSQESVFMESNFRDILWRTLLFLWFAGIAAMLIWALVSFLKLRRQVRASVREEKNVYLCDEIRSPFILGVFRPRIYLPSGLAGRQKELILSHEKAHLKRLDHIWKPLGFLLLSVYWFNPFLWLAYILLCRDIELACDERVTKELSEQERADYSQALLDCAHKRRAVSACPVAFGEVGVKQRVKSVLNYKKPAFWIVLAAVIASVVCAVCFLTDPKRNGTLSDQADQALITALNKALCEENNHYSGEFLSSQTTVLGQESYSDAKNFEGTIYFFYNIESFGFENGFFTTVGGGSGATAADYEILPDGSYEVKEIKEMGMGSEYGKSIQKAFPRSLVSRALSGATQKESDEMWEAHKLNAQRYLDAIGRGSTEIRQWGDVPHQLLTDLGVSVEVANNLNIADVWNAGYIGVWETLENGVRYVSENGFDREKNLLTFKKYQFDTGAVVFDLGLDASTGAVAYGATEPERQPESEGDGKVPTTYDDDGLIIPETAAAIPDTSRQAAVTPFDLPEAENPGTETKPYVPAPYTTNTADGKTGNERDWTTAAASANGRETTFSEATDADFAELGTDFDSGYFLDQIDVTFLRESAPGNYTADYDAATATDGELRKLLFYASHSFLCDRFLGEPETVQFPEKDDPFPELKNGTHRYVKYDKANIDWTATYILNAKAPDPGRFLDGASFAGYKDGYYYFVDEIFGVESDFTARAARITRQSDGTYLVETEYRDVFTKETLNGGGTLVVGLRDFGTEKIWSVLSYHANIRR
ncbi:MAG: hypothetical protein IJK23_08055 [Clostridia bacterium]|nr:hypothetical protein [Clostridia bacterium]